MKARNLPAGSVAASAEKVWIKRIPPKYDDMGPYWIGAEAYAWPFGDQGMQEMLDRGEVTILRVGTAVDQSCNEM